MARIRSVHPSLFTDEAWVSCSPLARLLYIGLWTDADDQGLFEWKPLQIKMRLMPGDSVDMPAMLEELVGANLIASLEAGGKKLGAIRYFRRFQRPKKPNATFVLPAEWRTYVGLSDAGSELGGDEGAPVPNQFPTGPEISPQMEDGGWRMEGELSVSNETGAEAPSVDEDLDPLADLRALPLAKGCWRLAVQVLVQQGRLSDGKARSFVGGLKAKGLTDDELWQIAEAAWREETGAPQPYLVKAAEGVMARRSDGASSMWRPRITDPDPSRQRMWMEDYREFPGNWKRQDRGPEPGQAGCQVTPEIQREFGVEPAKPQPVSRSA